MNSYRVILIGVLLVTAVAQACGPNFPPYIFNFREETMKSLPDQIFSEEVTKISTPESPQLVEQLPGGDSAAIWEEDRWVDPVHRSLLRTARRASSLEECRALVSPLPQNLQLYIEGAWRFYNSYNPADHLDNIALFDSLISFDSTGTAPLTVRAHYMKGRIYDRLHLMDSAIVSFHRTRELVKQGAPDSLGLGNVTYWSEGVVQWRRGNINSAMRLFVQQRAGSVCPDRSPIRDYTRRILNNDSLFRIALQDTVSQRVMASYISNIYSANSILLWDKNFVQKIEQLTAIILENPTAVDQNALDDIAAASYRMGKYDMARRLITGSSSAVSNLIRANLALRSGKMESAETYFNRVIKKRPQFYYEKNYIYFMVSRGRFEEAFWALCKSGGETRDVEYIAERLFTTKKLRTVVDEQREEMLYYLPSLRSLLAKRLLREGEVDAALLYFTSHREAAELYRAAHIGADTTTGIDRAEHLYTMVNLLRTHGMELIGYELGPDWSTNGGSRYGLKIQRKYSPGFASPQEYRMLKETEASPNHRFHYRYRAAELAWDASNLLPEKSSARDGIIAAGQAAVNHNLVTKKHALSNYRARFDASAPDFDAERKRQK